MKHLLKPVYLLSDTNNFIISFHKLQGVDFCLYGFCHHEGFYKGKLNIKPKTVKLIFYRSSC